MLSACSTTPEQPTRRQQPRPIVDNTLPPELKPGTTPRQRIVDIALQEWQRWGAQQVEAGADGRGCVTRIATSPEFAAQAIQTTDTAVTDPAAAANAQPCLRYPDGMGMEATPTGCLLALRYWHELGREPDCTAITTPRWAWSAAFISWVMRRAGLDEHQFLTGQAHNMYVTDARDGLLSAGAFRVEPYPAMPAAGDMICSARDALRPLSDVSEITLGRTPMHCDIVVAFDSQAQVLSIIGGNVQQSVSMSLIDLRKPPDAGPRLLTVAHEPEMDEAERQAGPPWLLVMRNRLP